MHACQSFTTKALGKPTIWCKYQLSLTKAWFPNNVFNPQLNKEKLHADKNLGKRKRRKVDTFMKEPSTNCYLDWNLSQIMFCPRHWLWKESSLISFISEEGSQTYFPKCNHSTYIDLSQPMLELLYLRQKVLVVFTFYYWSLFSLFV